MEQLLTAQQEKDQLSREISASFSSGAIATTSSRMKQYMPTKLKTHRLYLEWNDLVDRAMALIQQDIDQTARDAR